MTYVRIRSYDLPDDVFEPGETKPTRPKKKPIVRKRSLEQEVCPDPSQYCVMIFEDRPSGRNHLLQDLALLITITHDA